MDMQRAPHRLTCLDHPLLSTPVALYAHRKGIIFTVLLRGTVALVGVILTTRVGYSMLAASELGEILVARPLW